MEKVKLKTKLNPRQLLFLNAYFKLGNATKAVIEAGYNSKHPDKYAVRLMANPLIKSEVVKRREIAQKKIDITFEWKLNQLKNIVLDLDSTKQDAIKAIEVMNKMQGDNAPEKHVNANLNMDGTLEQMISVSNRYFDDYQKRLSDDAERKD